MRQLFEEYNNTVSTASVEDFCRTVLAWLEQHCSLPALRPGNYQSSCLLHEYVKTLCNLKNYMSYACVNFRSEFEKVWQTICLTSYSSPVVCLITSLCGAQHGARRERRVRSKRVSQRCAVPHGVWKRLGTGQISHVKFKIASTSVILLRLRASFTSEICLIKIDIKWIFPFKDLLRNGQRRHWAMMFFSSAALSSLRDLSKATSILSDPSKVPEQALRAAASRDPTDLAAMMAPAGANGGPGNTGAQGGGFS